MNSSNIRSLASQLKSELTDLGPEFNQANGLEILDKLARIEDKIPEVCRPVTVPWKKAALTCFYKGVKYHINDDRQVIVESAGNPRVIGCLDLIKGCQAPKKLLAVDEESRCAVYVSLGNQTLRVDLHDQQAVEVNPRSDNWYSRNLSTKTRAFGPFIVYKFEYGYIQEYKDLYIAYKGCDKVFAVAIHREAKLLYLDERKVAILRKHYLLPENELEADSVAAARGVLAVGKADYDLKVETYTLLTPHQEEQGLKVFAGADMLLLARPWTVYRDEVLRSGFIGLSGRDDYLDYSC